MSLDENQFFNVHTYNSTKEIWDTLEIIHEVSPSIKQEETNTRGKEYEWFFYKCFSIFRMFENNIITFVANKNIRINNWNHKTNPTLKSKDGNVYDFQE